MSNQAYIDAKLISDLEMTNARLERELTAAQEKIAALEAKHWVKQQNGVLDFWHGPECTRPGDGWHAISEGAIGILEAERKARQIAELKNKGTLANNLCPDHRDKQVGQPCLACTIERERKAREEAEAKINAQYARADAEKLRAKAAEQNAARLDLLNDNARDALTIAERRLAEVFAETRERCAKVCEEWKVFKSYAISDADLELIRKVLTNNIAPAIRSLESEQGKAAK